MTPERVAGIVSQRDSPSFVQLLRQADGDFADACFEDLVADALRSEPRLVDAWSLWSADQRWSPSAYVEGSETGWFDDARVHVQVHADQASAVANFIRRMAAWMARRAVVTND